MKKASLTLRLNLCSSPVCALLLMISAQFFFSLMTYFIKWAHTLEAFHSRGTESNSIPFGTWESVLFRCFPMMLISISLHLKKSISGFRHPSLSRSDIVWLSTRGILGAASMACFFHGTLTIPLGIASFFVNSSVFLIGLLGHYFLKETMTLTRSIFALSGLSGVALILTTSLRIQDTSISSQFMDYLISFSAGVLSAFAYFSLRKMTSIPGNTIILSLSTAGVVLAATMFTFVVPLRLPESKAALGLLIASSFPAIIAQFLMTRAFKTGEAGFVALGQYSGPVFSTLIGYFAFSDVLTPLQWLGALIVFMFGVLLPLLETKKSLRNSVAYQRL